MSRRFNPNDYIDVAERIQRFYDRHPEGRIVTEMATWNDDGIVFRAAAYRDRTQPVDMPDAVGWAHEVPGQGHVNKTSALENCETSAIGRALANLGFPVKPGEPRPSKQEMQKVERANQGVAVASDALLKEIAEAMHHPEITEEERGKVQTWLAEREGRITEAQARQTYERLTGWIAERTRAAA